VGSAENTLRRLGEFRVETIDMQFRQEELRNGLRRVDVAIGAARHLQPVKGIDGGHLIAKREENPLKGGFSGGQIAGRPLPETYGAQRSVVECDAAALRQRIANISRAARNPFKQIMEKH